MEKIRCIIGDDDQRRRSYLIPGYFSDEVADRFRTHLRYNVLTEAAEFTHRSTSPDPHIRIFVHVPENVRPSTIDAIVRVASGLTLVF